MVPSLLQWQETTQQMTPAEKPKASGSCPEHFQTHSNEPWPASPPQSRSITQNKGLVMQEALGSTPAQHQEVPFVSYSEVLSPECRSLMEQHSLMSEAREVQGDSQVSSCTPWTGL